MNQDPLRGGPGPNLSRLDCRGETPVSRRVVFGLATPRAWPHPVARALVLGTAVLALYACARPARAAAERVFRAGAYAVDITPTNFPVIINGGFLPASATNVHDPLHARCLVLDDGEARIGIGVIDTCVIPRELADRAKALIQEATGLRADRLLLSATHTHYAPSLMQTLGTPPDPHYPDFLLGKLVEGFRRAVNQLAPARVGWAVTSAPEYTHNRVWVRRPDRINTNPFGERTVRADMHPGYQNPDTVGPSGPADSDLTVIALQSVAGRPLALLANYAMHYHGGASPVSADYFGAFATKVGRLLGADDLDPPFVGIMAQGCAGDLHWMDYGKPAQSTSLDDYAAALARLAHETCQRIQYHDWVPLGMRDLDLALPVRMPDAARLEWARGVVQEMQGRPPKSLPEVYAQEQLWLEANPVRTTKLQALRLGELGLTAFSGEVFAITSLKLKAQSPFPTTVNLELANGEDGYIPPPEHHPLGSYNTWACRTACLEVNAEPKVVNALLGLLEDLSGKARRPFADTHGDYAQFVLKAEPLAYWRLNDLTGSEARDATRHGRPARFEPGVVFGLDGPASTAFSGPDEANRAAHFAGGRLVAPLARPGSQYSVELWFWNGLPSGVRGVTGRLLDWGDRLALSGTNGTPGCLVYYAGASAESVCGTNDVPYRKWTHLVFTRDDTQVVVYLNGLPEIVAHAPLPAASTALYLGGAEEPADSWEGKLDEIAIYDRPLGAAEVLRHLQMAGLGDGNSTVTRVPPDPAGPYATAVLDTQPLAYWRLGENGYGGRRAFNGAAPEGHGRYDEAVELYELGPSAPAFSSGSGTNHAARFVGGRMQATVAGLGPSYSVSLWFWNERANDVGAVTGYVFSRGPDGADGAPGDHLGIGGTHLQHEGRLFCYNGNALGQVVAGRTVLTPRTWNHVVFVREGRKVTAYLNGRAEPEFEGELDVSPGAQAGTVFLGGRNDSFANFQGRLDEVALFDRAVSAAEAHRLFTAADAPVPER